MSREKGMYDVMFRDLPKTAPIPVAFYMVSLESLDSSARRWNNEGFFENWESWNAACLKCLGDWCEPFRECVVGQPHLDEERGLYVVPIYAPFPYFGEPMLLNVCTRKIGIKEPYTYEYWAEEAKNSPAIRLSVGRMMGTMT